MAIDSVLMQTGLKTRPEIIIVDDGSTDDTAAKVAAWVADGLVQYIWQPNTGKAAATRLGIEKATGDVLFTLDADDYFLPGKIAQTLAILEQYPGVVHVASQASIRWLNIPGKEIAEAIPAESLGIPLNGMALLKSFYQTNKLFGGGSTFSCRMQVAKAIYWTSAIDMYTDEWLVIQALLQGDSYFLPQPVSVWQIHGANYSVQQPEVAQNRYKRLNQSGLAVLNALQYTEAPDWLVQLYGLKHAIRKQVWAEQAGTKTFRMRWQWLLNPLLSFKYPVKTLLAYHAPQRLIK